MVLGGGADLSVRMVPDDDADPSVPLVLDRSADPSGSIIFDGSDAFFRAPVMFWRGSSACSFVVSVVVSVVVWAHALPSGCQICCRMCNQTGC